MVWVRYDDQFPIHRKVAPLDDATFRLVVEALSWCSRNTTDGRIAADELSSISKRATKVRAANLVRRGVWHELGHDCPSSKCPPLGEDGWVIHDYLEYQFAKEKIQADLAAKAERTRKWRERKAGGASRDVLSDASQDTDVSSPRTRPRPAPKGAGSGTPERQPAAIGGRAASGVETATRPSLPCPTCGNAPESSYHQRVCRKSIAAEELNPA